MINFRKYLLTNGYSRFFQAINFFWLRVLSNWWYKKQLLSLGKNSIISKPLFWTPEFIHIGDNVLIWQGCRIEGIIHKNKLDNNYPRIFFGNDVVMQQFCHITAAGFLEIGSGTLISYYVSIQDTDHCYDDISQNIYKQPLKIYKTSIGENCFIGARVSILAGTILGRHCVVGANSVVRGKFPDYCVLVGAPARVVRRYDKGQSRWRRTNAVGIFLDDDS